MDLSALSPILRHALESFEHGILHYLDATELGRKFALLHLDHSIELVLKEKIAGTGRSIYRKDGRTISVHEAYGALSNTSIPERPRLEDLHDFRNIIQHKGLTPDEHTTEFHVTQAYKFMKRFLKDELGVDLSAYLPHSLVVAMEGLEAGHEELTEEAKRLFGAAERAFSSGDYATAVFSGFTALEITARDRGGMTKDGIPFPSSLLDLLYHCTQLEAKARANRRRQEARAKSLDFFLNLSSFCRFSEALAHCDGLGILHPLREGQRFEPEGYDLAITPVAAKHEELGKRHVAIGLLFDLLDRDRNCLCRVGITGDSGFKGRAWARKFAGVDVLVAHIGTISEDEVLRGKLYEKHLGFRGLFRLCETLGDEDHLPRVLLISEFGEELKGFRLRIAELLQGKIGAGTQVFAADIGLRVQLSPNPENIYVPCSHGHPGSAACISAATRCVDKDGLLLAVCSQHAYS